MSKIGNGPLAASEIDRANGRGDTYMTRYIGVRCKTVGCQTLIATEETQDSRIVLVPLKTKPWIETIRCPTCGNEYEYTEQDLEPHEENN